MTSPGLIIKFVKRLSLSKLFKKFPEVFELELTFNTKILNFDMCGKVFCVDFWVLGALRSSEVGLKVEISKCREGAKIHRDFRNLFASLIAIYIWNCFEPLITDSGSTFENSVGAMSFPPFQKTDYFVWSRSFSSSGVLRPAQLKFFKNSIFRLNF